MTAVTWSVSLFFSVFIDFSTINKILVFSFHLGLEVKESKKKKNIKYLKYNLVMKTYLLNLNGLTKVIPSPIFRAVT
jgi:hypothetical protein